MSAEAGPASSRPQRRRVVVVGGGIAGLTAALRLAQRGYAVELLEGSPRTGGKLLTGSIAGVQVDLGAEAMLARRPEAVGLAREVGLADAVRDPGTTKAGLWARDGLRAFPRPMVQGVPGALDDLERTGILTADEVARAGLDEARTGVSLTADVSVGELVGDRLGPAVVERLVEPLLGGVYAGRADELSLRACLPQLWPALTSGSTLMAAVRAVAPPVPAADPSAPAPVPVFAGLDGGVARLAAGVRAAAEGLGAVVRTGTTVRVLEQTADGWRLTCGSTRDPEYVNADAVVLACPAAPTSRLLARIAPGAATELAEIPYASMAIVTFAVRRERPFEGSGFLAGAGSLAAVKGATYSSTKWPWLAERCADGMAIVRASIGRRGDERTLQRDDAELIEIAAEDLRRVLASTGDTNGLGEVIDASVSRWGGGLPQYTVGHLDRVDRIRRAVASVPGLEVAGAAYDGVGIPACIASADRAVAALDASLRGPRL